MLQRQRLGRLSYAAADRQTHAASENPSQFVPSAGRQLVAALITVYSGGAGCSSWHGYAWIGDRTAWARFCTTSFIIQRPDVLLLLLPWNQHQWQTDLVFVTSHWCSNLPSNRRRTGYCYFRPISSTIFSQCHLPRLPVMAFHCCPVIFCTWWRLLVLAAHKQRTDLANIPLSMIFSNNTLKNISKVKAYPQSIVYDKIILWETGIFPRACQPRTFLSAAFPRPDVSPWFSSA